MQRRAPARKPAVAEPPAPVVRSQASAIAAVRSVAPQAARAVPPDMGDIRVYLCATSRPQRPDGAALLRQAGAASLLRESSAEQLVEMGLSFVDVEESCTSANEAYAVLGPLKAHKLGAPL